MRYSEIAKPTTDTYLDGHLTRRRGPTAAEIDRQMVADRDPMRGGR